ncbi:MAG: glycosyl hydrolase, partial [Acidobacteriota bacterium]|nr:glycosyl hydrolase [Acidobacteriota bacterium]
MPDSAPRHLRPLPPARPASRHRFPPLALLALLLPSLLQLLASAPAGATAAGPTPPTTAPPASPAETLIKGLRWREVGPYRGGRVAAVCGVPGQRSTYYFGATGGGVWRSSDAGRSWQNLSDGSFGGSIGSVAVAEWDPNVIYVGTGEVTVRGNVSEGHGVWKSTDAGKSWKPAGLADSRHIPRLRVHPKNPELVYAAVLGHLFGPSSMRGVYRSQDGGAHWDRVLYLNEEVGAADLAMDPSNPRILYATLWRVRRTPSSLESGGAGSGLWKSTDGGDTWTELTHNPGLPEGTLGLIGITVSPTRPDNLYAVVEAEEGGVFRSQDGGKTWARTNDDRDLRQRAWYYSRLYADPKDPESVYAVNVQFHVSHDGGKTFSTLPTAHGDNHDLWLAPDEPARMILANDGGATVSEDGGRTWSAEDNQPTAQIYRVAADNHFPYRLYGAQQDNSALRIASRSLSGPGIGRRDWEETAGGESGYVVPDPKDPEVVFGGSYSGFLVRRNHRTGEIRDVNPWPNDPMGWGAADLRYRFQWNFPILFSPSDPATLYAAANVLWKSTDAGQSWQRISPDLTRDDKSKQGPSGGPITKDNTSIEYYDTIFAVAASRLDPGVLWAGSDDGLVHLSQDGGKTWRNVTPKGLPEWSQVNAIDADPWTQGGAYLAATRYKLDDRQPSLWKTSDFGRTWSRIDRGIDREHFTRVVRADPVRRGLLYAGTEEGVYVSWDDGGRWQKLQANLPVVPVTDLLVHAGDLVAATQGRGFWILDDLTPLRELAAEPAVAAAPLHLFALRPAHR